MSFQQSMFAVHDKQMKFFCGHILKSILCVMSLLLLQFVTWARTSSMMFETAWLSHVFPSINHTQSTLSPTAKMSLVPGYVLQLYNGMAFEDDDRDHYDDMRRHTEAIRSFTVRRERVMVGQANVVKMGLSFNLTFLPQDANIWSVELVIPVNLGVRRLRIINTRVTFEGVPLQLMRHSSTQRDYLVFNATEALLAHRLGSNPWVEVSPAHFRQNSTQFFQSLRLDSALIVVYENINASNLHTNIHRNKRHATDSFLTSFGHFNSTENTTHTDNVTSNELTECDLHPWYVDFLSLGWFWIVHPPGYYANTCGGACTTEMGQNRTSNYAALKSLYHRQTNYQHVGNPSVSSCTPTEMSSVHLLYYNINGDIISKRLPQMAVKECGCR